MTRMRAGAGCLFWIEVNSMVAEWPSPSPGWAVPMPRLNTAMAARSMIFNVRRPWPAQTVSLPIRHRDGDHHMRRLAGVIDQPGAAPVSAIDQPESDPVSSIASCSCWDCRNAAALVPQMMAVKARAAKTNFFMGRNPTR